MNITQEQIEKVCRYTSVTPEEARTALVQANGSPLDAVILLERQNTRGGSWSTRWGAPPEEPTVQQPPKNKRSPQPTKIWPQKGQKVHIPRITLNDILDAIKSLIRNCTCITIDVWRKDDMLVGIPLIICILLFIVAYYVMIPLTIIGLILRCRYHISGRDYGEAAINRTMDQVSDTVADWSGQVWREVKDHHDKRDPNK